MTAPNAELAWKVLDQIDADPASWMQNVWIAKANCGTVACFAGWTCLLSGDVPAAPEHGDDDEAERVVVPWKGSTYVPLRAANLLGIPYDISRYRHGHDLFDSDNTREDLGLLVEAIFGPRPEPTS